MKTKPFTTEQIRKAYKTVGLKVDKIAKTRLGDGFYVYHRYGAEAYSKAYPGRRRDFVDSASTDSLGISITEAMRRAGLPNLKGIKKIIARVTKETKKASKHLKKGQKRKK